MIVTVKQWPRDLETGEPGELISTRFESPEAVRVAVGYERRGGVDSLPTIKFGFLGKGGGYVGELKAFDARGTVFMIEPGDKK